MKVVLDTNVVVSGIFFGGVPRTILDAWAAGGYELVLSPGIYDEYVRTCERLGASRPRLEYHGYSPHSWVAAFSCLTLHPVTLSRLIRMTTSSCVAPSPPTRSWSPAIDIYWRYPGGLVLRSLRLGHF